MFFGRCLWRLQSVLADDVLFVSLAWGPTSSYYHYAQQSYRSDIDFWPRSPKSEMSPGNLTL